MYDKNDGRDLNAAIQQEKDTRLSEIKKLLQNGADPNQYNDSALALAFMLGKPNILALLLDHCKKISPSAIWSGSLATTLFQKTDTRIAINTCLVILDNVELFAQAHWPYKNTFVELCMGCATEAAKGFSKRFRENTLKHVARARIVLEMTYYK